MSPASAEGPSHISRYPSSWRGNQKPEAIKNPQETLRSKNKKLKKSEGPRVKSLEKPPNPIQLYQSTTSRLVSPLGGRVVLVVGLGDLSPDMWQGFEKVRRPHTQATQAPPPAHPLITRIAPRHKARVPHLVEYRLAHRPRGMPGYAHHQAGDVQPALHRTFFRS